MSLFDIIDSSRSPASRCAGREHHINFVWPHIDRVTYPRHPVGSVAMVISLTDPKQPPTPVSSHLLLRTAALDHPELGLRRCMQYEYKGCCEKGPLCKYVHEVRVDPLLPERRRFRLRKNGTNTPAALERSLMTPDTSFAESPRAVALGGSFSTNTPSLSPPLYPAAMSTSARPDWFHASLLQASTDLAPQAASTSQQQPLPLFLPEAARTTPSEVHDAAKTSPSVRTTSGSPRIRNPYSTEGLTWTSVVE